MSSTEPSFRLLPPWERSVSTVSCSLPSWGGGEGRVRGPIASQPWPPGRHHRGWDHQGQLRDAKNEGDPPLCGGVLRNGEQDGGYPDVNAAVDWIVVSCHWLSLVQLPSGSIIPPGEGEGLVKPGVQLPFPSLSIPHSPFIPSLPHSEDQQMPPQAWAPTHHGPPFAAPSHPTSSPGSPGHCCLCRRVPLSPAQCQSD